MTDKLVNQPTTRTTRKVRAASLGAAAGVPVGALVAYLLTRATGIPVDEQTGELIYALTMTVAGGLGSWVSGWWTKERAG